MAQVQPIKLTKLIELTQLGIQAQSISFNTVALESDKYICVREPSGGIAMIDVQGRSIVRHNINVDAALTNPVNPVVALRAQNLMQIFDLDKKNKINSFQMTEAVQFWKWISVEELAFVTPTAVFHWNITAGQQPRKMFDRAADMQSAQIINYRTDRDRKWLLMCGLAPIPTGGVRGVLQLYSVEKKLTQPIDGHAAAFASIKLPGNQYESSLVCIASNNNNEGKVLITEVSAPAGAAPFKRAGVIQFADPTDFPVSMQASDKFGLIFIISRTGYLYVYDVESAMCIFSNRVSTDPIFVTTSNSTSSGLLGISRSGVVLEISVDERNVVKYMTDVLGNYDGAIRLASRANISSGGNELFEQQFQRLLMEQPPNIQRIAEVVSSSPNGFLRTPDTIRKLGQLPSMPGQPPAVLQYFKTLLDTGKLNVFESVELARLALQKTGGVQYVEKLMNEEKVTCSEELGDLVSQMDRDVALKIYFKGNAHNKVVLGLVHKGAYQQVFQYAQKVSYTPDYHAILANLVNLSPDSAVQFATMLAQEEGQVLIDVNRVVDLFVQRSLIPQVAGFLLEVLKNNREEDGPLQTRLLEINLMYNFPQVADQILGNGIFTHFDKARVAQLCEKCGLFQRALENYTDIRDIKRCVVYTHMLNPEWLVTYFANLSIEDSLACLKELLNNNILQNLQLVVQIATRYSEELSPKTLIDLFETFKSYEGLFYYLGGIVNFSEDGEVHFKYIEAAVKVGQVAEVERVTRESSHYDAERVKRFLMDAKLPDMWPLVNVCDRFNFVEEMTKYLYQNNQIKYIDPFVQRKNPQRTPLVIGALLDVDAPEDYIKNLIYSVGNMCPVEPLVEEVEKRNRLKVIKEWLESRVREGNQDPVLHNSVGKIYIDSNLNPEQFLQENQFYDPRVIGKYCEKRDPHLAMIAYKRGLCDYEIVDLTNKNSMFRDQARYLVDRQSEELWAHVLKDDNEFRRQMIDQVVQTALPETRSPDKVSCAVKAFMTADLPTELIELLEKIVLHGDSEFKRNKNLQNLLLLTSIRADRTKVMDYIERLDNYDGSDIANIAVGSQLYEEAFAIYKKFKLNKEAVNVLLDCIGSIERGLEFAKKVNEKEVWSLLAAAQLRADLVTESVDSYLKAEDPSSFALVIEAANRLEKYEDLVRFLRMARLTVKEAVVDTEMVYALAKTGRLSDLEEFITSPNIAKLQDCGERLFKEAMYEAAKTIFSSIGNFPRLASTLIKLKQFQQAFEAARKANLVKTWKEVCLSCVDVKEFRLAQLCGLHVIVHADELEHVVSHYERYGFFDELITLLEAGLGLERAHVGVFTELGILYAKYRGTKLMDHLKIYWKRSNIPKLLRACEEHHHWAELRFLYQNYDEPDNALLTMINHPADAFDHSIFKDVVQKSTSSNIYYRSVSFYMTYQPTLLCDLLNVVSEKIDNARLVQDVRREGHLALIKSYLLHIQHIDNPTVNEAVNSLHLQDEDFEALRESFDQFKNFDQINLAMQCEKNDLVEFRRIAAYIYKKNERWSQSVDLSKKDMLLKDAIATASESANREVAEELLRFFVQIKRLDCFVATLYSCYDSIRADVALDIAWRNGLLHYVVPFLVQVVREYTDKVEDLLKDKKAREEKEEKEAHEPSFPPPLPMQATGMLTMQPTGMIAMQPTGMLIPGRTILAPRGFGGIPTF